MVRNESLAARRIAVAAFVLAFAAIPASAMADHSVLDLLSTGPAGGNAEINAFYRGASQDGKRVFLETSEPLVSTDTDGLPDVYERTGLTTTLVSTGPNGGSGSFSANFARASADGSRVFFMTSEALVSADTDSSIDVYERSGGTTTLISTGPNGGSGGASALYDGSSQDGSRVFFHTTERLVSTDTDNSVDLYERSGGTTTLISTGPNGGNGGAPAFFRGASQDGGHVYFETTESLVSGDTDSTVDVYERSNGTTTWLSFGPTGGNGGIDEFFDASFAGASQDGSRVFFQTNEQLVSTDTDVQWDVYERSSGTTTLVSTGPTGGNGGFDADFRGASADGTRVFFQTREPLVMTDFDLTDQDVYERSAGTTTLVSTAPGDTGASGDASFAGASEDGSHVFFSTPVSLLTADTDGGWRDIYERSGGVTSLVSTGPTDPNGPTNAFFTGASRDGARVFFHTTDPLVANDTDGGYDDVYERFGGATTLISAGGNGPSTASFAGASQDGSRVFFHTGEPLLATDADSSQDVYVASVAASYTRPIGASPMRIPLVPAFQPCNGPTPNGTHGGPLVGASCNPPVPRSGLAAVGANSLGFVRMIVLSKGKCAPFDSSHCYPDVTIAANITDVRAGSPSGADYDTSSPQDLMLVATLPDPGAVQGDASRITDAYNKVGLGDAYDQAATTSALPFPAPLGCTPTADPAVGSACSVQTTSNTLVPGAVIEGKRAVWELGQLSVLDQGADGVPGNADDRPFEVQGVFVP